MKSHLTNILAFLIPLIWGGWELYSAKSMDYWIPVKAEITSSKLHKSNTKYYPRITYRYCYRVECRTSRWVNNNVVGGYKSSEEAAETMLASLVGNGVVTVFVDPSDVDNVTMEKKNYFMGSALLILALINVIRLVRKSKSFSQG